MTIYCEHRGCGHHAIVDLEGIQAEYGDGFRVSGFVARSTCEDPGRTRVEVGRQGFWECGYFSSVASGRTVVFAVGVAHPCAGAQAAGSRLA